MNSVLRLLALSLAFWQFAVAAEPAASEFTSTSPAKSKILEDSSREKDPEIDHFTHLCPGMGAYQILHMGGDSRSWISLKVNGKILDLYSQTMSACPGHFPNKANDVLQWRGVREGGKFKPYAIIYRMTSTTDEEKGRTEETLVIIKLDGEKSKLIAHVPGKEGNEKAEAAADKLCRP